MTITQVIKHLPGKHSQASHDPHKGGGRIQVPDGKEADYGQKLLIEANKLGPKAMSKLMGAGRGGAFLRDMGRGQEWVDRLTDAAREVGMPEQTITNMAQSVGGVGLDTKKPNSIWSHASRRWNRQSDNAGLRNLLRSLKRIRPRLRSLPRRPRSQSRIIPLRCPIPNPANTLRSIRRSRCLKWRTDVWSS